MRVIISILMLFILLASCKKNKNSDAPETCSTNSGSFEITLGDNKHILQINDETNFTILYNWYGDDQNHWVIDGKDQNGEWVYLECLLPGKISKGTHIFDANSPALFDISLEPKGFSSTEITFEIVQSKLSSQDGVYKPIRGTFSGTGLLDQSSSAEGNPESISFSGKFCLNGMIL